MHIFRQFDRYQMVMGEVIIWYMFDRDTTIYDDVYDESGLGGKRYRPGKQVPVLWIDQIEPTETYEPEGRRPTNRIRCGISAQVINNVGIGADEASGGRVWDDGPDYPGFWADRAHDLAYYDGRYYEVSNFQIRGRVQEQDVIIGVSGIETQPDDRQFDPTPGS
jgi:hypothetical protein